MHEHVEVLVLRCLTVTFLRSSFFINAMVGVVEWTGSWLCSRSGVPGHGRDYPSSIRSFCKTCAFEHCICLHNVYIKRTLVHVHVYIFVIIMFALFAVPVFIRARACPRLFELVVVYGRVSVLSVPVPLRVCALLCLSVPCVPVRTGALFSLFGK